MTESAEDKIRKLLEREGAHVKQSRAAARKLLSQYNKEVEVQRLNRASGLTREQKLEELQNATWTSSRKWNDKSTYQLEERARKSARAAESLTLIREVLQATEREFKSEAARLIDLDPDEIELGSWECSNSPTKGCIYDVIEDPYQDSCIFCRSPRERK